MGTPLVGNGKLGGSWSIIDGRTLRLCGSLNPGGKVPFVKLNDLGKKNPGGSLVCGGRLNVGLPKLGKWNTKKK